jgi:hypothetical protein
MSSPRRFERRRNGGYLRPEKEAAVPKGPKGQKRPADVIGNAIKVARIATGEESEDLVDQDGKNLYAVGLGKRGGKARAKALTARQRSEIAKRAARKRWGS